MSFVSIDFLARDSSVDSTIGGGASPEINLKDRDPISASVDIKEFVKWSEEKGGDRGEKGVKFKRIIELVSKSEAFEVLKNKEFKVFIDSLGLDEDEICNLHHEGKLTKMLLYVYRTSQAESSLHEFFGIQKGERLSVRELTVFFQEILSHEAKWVGYKGGKVKLNQDRLSFYVSQLGSGKSGVVSKVNTFAIETLKVLTFSGSTVEKESRMYDENLATEVARDEVSLEYEILIALRSLAQKRGEVNVLKGLPKVYTISYQGKQAVMLGEGYPTELGKVYKTITTRDILYGMNSLIKAIAFVQSEKCVHLDIKPENIFVDSEGNFKLGDFASARFESDDIMEKGLSYSPIYTPLDIFTLKGSQPESLHRVGTFQMGVSFFQILSGGKFPYVERVVGKKGKLFVFQDTEKAFNRGVLSSYPPKLVNFVEALLHSDPSKRPTRNEIAKKWEEFIRNYGSLDQMINTIEQYQTRYLEEKPNISEEVYDKAVEDIEDDIRYCSVLFESEAISYILKDFKKNGNKSTLIFYHSATDDDYIIHGMNDEWVMQKIALIDLLTMEMESGTCLTEAGIEALFWKHFG